MAEKKTKKEIPEIGDLSATLGGIDEKMLELEAQRHLSINKALKSNSPLDLLRATKEIERITGEQDGSQKSYVFDFSDGQDGMGYRDKRLNITHTTLRQMAKTPVINAIIGTRQSQVMNFSKFSEDPQKQGWTIKKKSKPFAEQKDMTKSEKTTASKIAEFIINAGDTANKWHADSFESFLKKIVSDSLVLDQATAEIVRNRAGKPTEYIVTDGATFRYASAFYDPRGVKPEFLVDGQPPIYVQIYRGSVVADFYAWELMWGVRNQSTDIEDNGYGRSEVEDLIRIVTWMLNSDTYNGKFFSNGASPKGILKVSGNVNQKTLNNFKARWRAMVQGVENAWKTPVIESDKLEWVDLQKSNTDMQFHQWTEYLVRVACAVFKIDPSEIGFMQTGGSGMGSQYNSHKQKTDHSKDKGLYPLLKSIEHWINKWLVSEYDENFEFSFTGITVEDEDEALKNDSTRVSNWMTLNELRQKNGEEPIDGGDIVLNSNYIQALQMQQMGDEGSNEYVDDYTGEDGGNAYKQEGDNESDDVEKGDVFSDSLNDWLKRGAPNELVYVGKRQIK